MFEAMPDQAPEACIPALSAADAATLPDRALVEHITAWERVVSWASARQNEAMVELAHRRMDHAGDEMHSGWQERINEFAVDEIALALHLSRPAASRRFSLALALDDLPRTRTALHAGLIDPARARVIAETAECMPEHQRLALEAAVVPDASTQTVGQLRVAAARAAIATDPAAADRRHEAARAARRCEMIPLPDGMALMRCTLPAPEAAKVWAALDVHARQVGAGEARSMDQRRADALVELVTQASAPGASAQAVRGGGLTPSAIRVTISSDTLAGRAHDPGYLAGYGYLPPEVAREVCSTTLGEADPDVHTATGRVVPARTGATLLVTGRAGGALEALVRPSGHAVDESASASGYSPPPSLVEFIEARDVTCRFPGCRQPARRCDIDHVVPHPRGPTAPENLVCLCRHHHRLKQSAQWSVRVVPEGLEWTSPAGVTYLAQHAGVDPAAPIPIDCDLLPLPDDDEGLGWLYEGDLLEGDAPVG